MMMTAHTELDETWKLWPQYTLLSQCVYFGDIVLEMSPMGTEGEPRRTGDRLVVGAEAMAGEGSATVLELLSCAGPGRPLRRGVRPRVR